MAFQERMPVTDPPVQLFFVHVQENVILNCHLSLLGWTCTWLDLDLDLVGLGLGWTWTLLDLDLDLVGLVLGWTWTWLDV